MAGETKESGLDEFVAAREQLEKLIVNCARSRRESWSMERSNR